MKLLNEIVPDKYTIKAPHNDEVKIRPPVVKEYTNIIKTFKKN